MGLNSESSGPLANVRPTRSIGWYIYLLITHKGWLTIKSNNLICVVQIDTFYIFKCIRMSRIFSPGGSVPQSNSCTATYHPSRKLSKFNEPDMRDTAGEVGTGSCEPLHLDEQRLEDQLEPTYISSVPIRGVALKTCRKHWMIGRNGERGSGISVLIVQHDDVYIYIYIYIFHI